MEIFESITPKPEVRILYNPGYSTGFETVSIEQGGIEHRFHNTNRFPNLVSAYLLREAGQPPRNFSDETYFRYFEKPTGAKAGAYLQMLKAEQPLFFDLLQSEIRMQDERQAQVAADRERREANPLLMVLEQVDSELPPAELFAFTFVNSHAIDQLGDLVYRFENRQDFPDLSFLCA